MSLICAAIMCIVFPIGFGGVLISIESIFDKGLPKLYERIKNLEVHIEHLENLIKE